MINAAIFVSGSGSLLPSFADEARTNPDFNVVTVVADRKCPALYKAELLGFDTAVFKECGSDLLNFLSNRLVDIICLAGFLKILPADFIEKFDGKILNTHPSLLPKYSGKGFHGDNVHAAVLESGDAVSGFSVHEVTPKVDEGPVVFSKECPVYGDDTIESLRSRVQNLENEWYPKVAFKVAENGKEET